MVYITIEDYNRFRDYIHPHINDCIVHYRHKNIRHLPVYHSCDTVNKKGTRKLIDSEGEVSVFIQQIKDIGGKQS